MKRQGRRVFSTAFLLCLALGSGIAPAAAQELAIPDVIYPSLPNQAASAEGFAPQGWTLESEASGDINRDGIADIAFVLRQEDPKNIIVAPRFGTSPFDTNPRILAVAFRNSPSGDYALQAENHTLIPRCEDPNQADPYEGISIERGSLRVHLRLFMNAGGWDMFTATHIFRYRSGRFELIGYDRSGVHRASGNTNDVSVNYITGKMKLSTGHISSDNPTKVTWKALPNRAPRTLDDVGDGLAFDPDL